MWVTIWNYVAENNYCSRKETSKSLKSQDYSHILRQADPKYDTVQLTFLPALHRHWGSLWKDAHTLSTRLTRAKSAYRTGAGFMPQLSRFSLRHGYHQLVLLPSPLWISVDLEQRVRAVMIKKLTKQEEEQEGKEGRHRSSYGNSLNTENTGKCQWDSSFTITWPQSPPSPSRGAVNCALSQ